MKLQGKKTLYWGESMQNERRAQIVEAINQRGLIYFGALVDMFPDVSEMTLRKDLKFLDEEGKIVRIHGGARSLDTVRGMDMPLRQRLTLNIEKKQEIAAKALSFLQPGDSIFLDSGSTMTELAKLFPDQECTVFCGGLSCVNELSRLDSPDICLLGGMLNKSSLSVRDPRMVQEVECLHFDVAFISVNGFSPESGFSCRRPERQLVEQAVLRRSRKKVVLMDSTKLSRQYAYLICGVAEVDALISASSFPEEIRQSVERMGGTVL